MKHLQKGCNLVNAYISSTITNQSAKDTDMSEFLEKLMQN